MKQVNIRLPDEDLDRITFLTDYLREEGLLFGPTTVSGAIRFALRFTIDALTEEFEARVRDHASNPDPVDNPAGSTGDSNVEEKSNPDRSPDQ